MGEASLLTSDVLAKETHSGRWWSVVMLLATTGPVIALWLTRTAGIRAPLIAVSLVGLLGLGTSAMAWAGFQYRFLRSGVEVRMLGFRLRTIPKESIVSYTTESWSLVRGYGIRGIGRTRAYVWCNSVVHIKTSTGDIFLGHNQPERIVRDLDLVTGVVSRA
jgi:hypothetical protein